jgi:hypothetical protein
MSLVNCRECSHEVSDKTETCANCGAPNQRPSSVLTKVISFLVVFPFLLMFWIYLTPDPNHSTGTPRPVTAESKISTSTKQALDQVRGFISQNRYGTAIATAEKYDLSSNPELRQLHDDAVRMLAIGWGIG